MTNAKIIKKKFLRDVVLEDNQGWVYVLLNYRRKAGSMFSLSIPTSLLNKVVKTSYDGYNWVIQTNFDSYEITISDANIQEIYFREEYPEMYL